MSEAQQVLALVQREAQKYRERTDARLDALERAIAAQLRMIDELRERIAELEARPRGPGRPRGKPEGARVVEPAA